MLAAGAKDTLMFASASVIERPLPPLVRRDAHAMPQEDPADRVLARLRGGQTSDDPTVERLNTLSLQAALQGKAFSPRAMAASLASSRQTVTSPRQELPPSPP